MNRRWLGGFAVLSAAAIWTSGPAAQSQNRADWLTDGGDPQRTAWQRHETILTKDNVKDMKLLWKVQARQPDRGRCTTCFRRSSPATSRRHRERRRSRVVAGVSDNVYGIDVETGTLLWKKHFDSTFQEQPGGRGGGVLCPGGLTATPVLDQTSPGKYVAYAVSWDGRLRKLDVATGEEIEPPRAVRAAQRQAVRAQPRQRRHLHVHRAGMRRQSEQLLLVRSRDEEGRQLGAGQRRAVAADGAVGRQGRHRLRRAAATATTCRSSRSTGRR